MLMIVMLDSVSIMKKYLMHAISIEAHPLWQAGVESLFQDIHILVKLLHNGKPTTQCKLCIEVIYFD